MSTPDRPLRISDADRERAMADLSQHYADGRLDHEEYDERLDAIWTARTQADLRVLFDDLPRPQAAYPPARPARPARATGGRRRLPLLPVLALLIGLSILTHLPFWLLVFPLVFLGRCGRGHTRAQHDYSRPRRTPGW